MARATDPFFFFKPKTYDYEVYFQGQDIWFQRQGACDYEIKGRGRENGKIRDNGALR